MHDIIKFTTTNALFERRTITVKLTEEIFRISYVFRISLVFCEFLLQSDFRLLTLKNYTQMTRQRCLLEGVG